MNNRIKIKLNVDLLNFKKNHVLELACDDEGVPFNSFWRRRLLDSEFDNCVEVVKESTQDKKTPTKKAGE